MCTLWTLLTYGHLQDTPRDVLRIVVNDQKMWTAIAESKNETLHCPVNRRVCCLAATGRTSTHG